ncbi:hypothetical protein AKJ16_DCAP26448 [Drosera capensis]
MILGGRLQGVDEESSIDQITIRTLQQKQLTSTSSRAGITPFTTGCDEKASFQATKERGGGLVKQLDVAGLLCHPEPGKQTAECYVKMNLKKLNCGLYTAVYSFVGDEGDPENWKYRIVLEYSTNCYFEAAWIQAYGLKRTRFFSTSALLLSLALVHNESVRKGNHGVFIEVEHIGASCSMYIEFQCCILFDPWSLNWDGGMAAEGEGGSVEESLSLKEKFWRWSYMFSD